MPTLADDLVHGHLQFYYISLHTSNKVFVVKWFI